MPGFIHRARYASGSPEPEELGTVEQVRYVKSALLQRKITTFLEAQYAKKITKMPAPSQDIATQPVEEGYVAVCHTNLDPDIRDMPGLIIVTGKQIGRAHV